MEKKTVGNETSYYTRPSLYLPGGVISEPIFTDGYLLAVDGQGTLHAYTSEFEKNLAVYNMTNYSEIKPGSTADPVKENIVQKGKTYTVAADIVNFYNSSLVADIEYTINPETHNSKTLLQDQNILPQGAASYFTYTIPESYNEPYITIQCEINSKGPDGKRKIEDETIYEDNIQVIKIPVDLGQVDLKAKNIKSEDPALANAWQISTVDIVNHAEKQMNSVLVQYKLNGSTVKEERINLPPKGTAGRTFQWKAPNYNTKAILSVIVDPYREKENGNQRANNTTTKTVNVVKATSSNTGTCPGNSTSGFWQESYNIIIGYPTYTETYTDKDGNERTRRWTDYNDPIWETRTVTYHETLTYEVEVNTKQQYEDSRGGWEIIPYARKKGTPANKVTRSGYGIEITVRTNYNNDWETKVPKGLEGTASPKGGKFSGAQRVTAYLPNGTTVEMVPDKTPGPGVYNITWRLPEVSYTPPGTNEVWKGRYFAMDPRTPDGEYPFTIVIRGAGHEQLRCTAEEEIYIYGDVWRDINIKSKSN